MESWELSCFSFARVKLVVEEGWGICMTEYRRECLRANFLSWCCE